MPVAFSPANCTFHDDRIGPLPADAVPVDDELHAAMLAARSNGAIIEARPDGRPIARTSVIAIGRKRELMIEATKREAAARILAISPIWRQLNDARDLPLSHGTTRAAIEARFAAIDAVRTASDVLEASIATMSPRALTSLHVAAPSHWPKG